MPNRLRRAIRFALPVITGVTLALLSGCGDDSDGDSTNATSTEPPSLDPTVAQDAVTDYYAAIDNDAYGTAWRYLGTEQRQENQGFQTWKAGYTDTIETNLRTATPAVVDSDTVNVAVRLITLDAHSCDDRVRKTFMGTWVVDLQGVDPVLSNASIEELASRQLPSTCQPPPPTTTTTPPPPPADCDPNYPDPGVCLEPYAGSDTYNCTSGGQAPQVAPSNLTVLPPDPYGLDGLPGPSTSGVPGVGCEG